MRARVCSCVPWGLQEVHLACVCMCSCHVRGVRRHLRMHPIEEGSLTGLKLTKQPRLTDWPASPRDGSSPAPPPPPPTPLPPHRSYKRSSPCTSPCYADSGALNQVFRSARGTIYQLSHLLSPVFCCYCNSID